MDNFNVDAYQPKEIADQTEQISVSKSVTDTLRARCWKTASKFCHFL